MRFDSFEQVVSWYDRTKPMVSKRHTAEHDVRPIGDRARKWERIKKIDDNTYALCDGNYGNYIWSQANKAQHEYENLMAPIVWMRREDGDFIRIRNHHHKMTGVTRYNFLTYNLPIGMRFHYNQSGKHYVRAAGEDFFLPKCKVNFDHQRKDSVTDDGMFLMFRVNGDGTFTRVGDKLKVEVTRVDKDEKKQWRDKLDAFYQYCAAVAPMLDLSWSGRNDYSTMVRDYVKEHVNAPTWIRNTVSIPSQIMRDVVTNDEHPIRVAVAAMVVYDVNGKREVSGIEDLRAIKAAYNRVMNKAMGFYKIEEK